MIALTLLTLPIPLPATLAISWRTSSRAADSEIGNRVSFRSIA
jgi:hypothetical protein